MNRAYRHVWSHALQMFVAVAETARSRGKRSGGALLLAGTLAQAALAAAPLIPADTLPTNGKVTAGAAAIGARVGNTMTITQSSQKVAIDWLGFSVGQNATVNFVQPSASAIALNRVTGTEQSVIEGALNANGKVFILNSNGVLFTKGASINTAGLVASTMSLSNEDFMAGNYNFDRNGSNAAVVNFGNINVADGGYAALLGKTVSNQGTITAKLGTVALAAGERVSLNFNGDSLVNVTVDQPTLKALVENKQAIYADGGTVILTSKAVDALMEKVVNNEGVIAARSVRNQGGRVFLDGGDSGLTVNAGSIDVSSTDGVGGTVVATGDRMLLAAGSTIDASGATGGGEVYVGGGRQGRDAAIRNANSTVMENGARIDVSATDSGNGGSAVLFASLADGRTDFGGTILARGGASGGDGGFIETSAATVSFRDGMRIDAGAAQGRAGDWLIDPVDITIDATLASAIVTALNSSNVAISTSGSNTPSTAGGESGATGDITVASAIAKTGGSATTLTLAAHNDINVNAAISSSSGRLNVVLTADADASSAGSVNFGAAGSVTTSNGNFVAGIMTNSDPYYRAAKGQNFTMAAGSFVDVGSGALDIAISGTATLAANSLKTGSGAYYKHDGTYGSNNYLRINAAGIQTGNTVATTPDIVAYANVTLNASSIGAAAAGSAIKISAPTADSYQARGQYLSGQFKMLDVTNTGGSTYVDQITNQLFNNVRLTLGTQASSVHNINVMGDVSGHSHVNVTTDASGNIVVGANGIDTTGNMGSQVAGYWYAPNTSAVFPLSVSLSNGSKDIIFSNSSANVGSYGTSYRYGYGTCSDSATCQYYSAFNTGATDFRVTSTSGTIKSDNAGDGTKEITANYALYLSAPNIGTAADPLELAGGSILDINNTGGSTYVKVRNDGFSTVNLANVKTASTHSILFSGGDHIDYTTDGSVLNVPTIAGGATQNTAYNGQNISYANSSNGATFGGTFGIDTSRGGRAVKLTAKSGDIVFNPTSVATGQADFTAVVDSLNTTGNIRANAHANASTPEITAGNLYLTNYGSTAGTFGIASGAYADYLQIAQGTSLYQRYQAQIAQPVTPSVNTLTVYTNQGDVKVRELTTNHFKTLKTTLNGASAAQSVIVDLAGADDVNFSDSGSLVSIDATKANLSSYNRNWDLTAGSRNIQIDGVSFGTGYYYVTGSRVKLNSDVMTNGGEIKLIGYSYLDLLTSVRVDSNADDTGNTASTGSSGNITLNGGLSATAGNRSLTADSSSSTNAGGTITMYSGAGNYAGSYLTGLTLVSSGSTTASDGTINLQGFNYNLNGNFSSTGYTYLYYPTGIDTEQGNTASGGNITFAGRDLYAAYNYGMIFNTSTTAAGMNGGNVDLYGTTNHSALSLSSLAVTATGGSGGTSGSIALPAVTTTYNGTASTQSYVGGIITLNGNLQTNWGNVTLTGDTRLANNVVIDTWNSTYAYGTQQTRSAGSVTINGTGVSATAAGKTLTIDTHTDTGAGYYTGTTDWQHSGGAVSLVAGNGGGSYLDTLTINTAKGGTHNTASNGTITLNGITTGGAQTYSGGATTIAGNLTGSSLGLSGVASIALTGDRILSGDSMSFGTVQLSGSGALTLKPTTAGTTIGVAGGAGTLSLGSTFFSTNLQNGFSQITVGSSASGDMSFGNGGVTYADPLKLVGGGNIALAGALADAGSGTSSGSFTALANNGISLASGTSIATHNQAILLNANTGGAADGSGVAGGIDAHAGAISLNSGGGNITVGGGSAGDGSGYATGMTGYAGGNGGNMGIAIADGSTIDAGGGNIALRGQGKYSSVTGRAKGIEIGNGSAGTTTIATSGGGAITFDGKADAAHSGNWNYGVNFNTGGTINVQAANGNITIAGIGGGSGAAATNPGVNLEGSGTIALAASGSGNIAINGTAGNGATSQNVDFGSGTRSLTANTGDIEVRALGANGGLTLPATLTVARTGSGNIVLDAGHGANGHFIDNGATINAGAGRWLVYSYDKAGDTYGTTAPDFRKWGQTLGYATLAPAAVTETGNGVIHVVAQPVAATTSTTTSTTLDSIITQIVNHTIVQVPTAPVPSAGSPTAMLNQLSATTPATTVVVTSVAPQTIRGDFGDGATLTVASRPSEGVPSTLITLDQLLQMQQSSAPAAPGQSAASPAAAVAQADVRVRISANSLVEMVNGGVRLPSGVVQEFFVVREQ